MKCSLSPETTEAMRGEMAVTLKRSSAGESVRHLAFFLLTGGEAVGDLKRDWPATGGGEPVSLGGKERAGVTSFQVLELSSYLYSGPGLREKGLEDGADPKQHWGVPLPCPDEEALIAR